MNAYGAAEAIRVELERGDIDFAFRVLAMALHEFRSGDEAHRDRFLETPASTGSQQWDTLLGAVIGRECDAMGRKRPSWANPKRLDEEWVATALESPSKRWIERIKSRTPKVFSDLGIWFDPKNLEIA